MNAHQRTTPGILLALVTLLAAAGAMAGPGGGPGIPPPGKFARLADELGLDAEVKAALTAQLQAAREEGKARREALRAQKEALRALLDAEPPDRAAVMAQIEKIGALQVEMHKHRVGVMMDLQAALSPEQRAALKEKMQTRRRGKRHGKRGRRGGPPVGPPPGAE